MQKLFALLGLALPLLVFCQTTIAAGTSKPAPVQMLEKQGLTIMGSFAAPGGMTGYAGVYQGDPIAIYVTPDNQHAILGTMIDAQGNNLTIAPLQKIVIQKQRANAWPKLKQSTWVADGSADADRVIYMFTDANCPYCHQFWLAARPWVNAGQVQIRHVMVGIIKASSLPKAAAILSADDPNAALTKDERSFNDGGITPMQNVPAGLAAKIHANFKLMRSMGLYGTPAIFYRGENGKVHVIQGVAHGKLLATIMGSPKP